MKQQTYSTKRLRQMKDWSQFYGGKWGSNWFSLIHEKLWNFWTYWKRSLLLVSPFHTISQSTPSMPASHTWFFIVGSKGRKIWWIHWLPFFFLFTLKLKFFFSLRFCFNCLVTFLYHKVLFNSIDERDIPSLWCERPLSGEQHYLTVKPTFDVHNPYLNLSFQLKTQMGQGHCCSLVHRRIF